MKSANGRGRAVVIPAFVCAAMIGAGVCLAQLQADEPLTPVIGRLPQTAALVIVSPRPAHVLEQLKGPWRKLGPIASGLASPALDGWALFTKELGYGPQEGFDALTSGGVAIVIGPPHEGGGGAGHGAVKIGAGGAEGAALHATIEDEPHWAIASVVKSETAANLRQRLRAAPHGVVGGVPVLSVEDGRFALVCRPLSNQPNADELLVLAPMDDRGFFDSVVAAVEPARPAEGAPTATPTLSATPAFAMAQRTKADILIIAAERADRTPQADWSRGSVVSCTLAPKSWVIEGASASAQGKARDQGHLSAEASVWFDQWSPRAAAMVVGGGFRELIEAIETADPAGVSGPLVRLKGVDAAGVFIGPPASQPGVKKDGALPDGGGLSIWAALRVRERRLLEDGELDAAGCAVANAFERGWRAVITGQMNGDAQKATTPAPEPGSFAALPAGAARVVTVRLSPGDVLSGNATDVLPGTVTWVRAAASGRGGAASEPDWSVMGIEPVGDLEQVAQRQRSITAILSSPAPAGGPAVGKDWVWRGVLRPRAVLRGLPMPVGFALTVAGVGSVGEVRFEAWNESGEQHSRVVIDWEEKDPKP